MKGGLRVLAVVLFLCGLAAGGAALWLYTRALELRDAGTSLKKEALRIYDQSDDFKGTPEEDRLVAEGQSVDQSGDATLAEARTSRLWAMTSGIASILLVLAAIAAILTHLKRKEAAQPS
ncbi:MAG TPA: hypothetical protein VN256_08385 [Pyrinomonadaceae bacterium]|nr:hypothetical protein [Pyrinomonadaceae bacterium]